MYDGSQSEDRMWCEEKRRSLWSRGRFLYGFVKVVIRVRDTLFRSSSSMFGAWAYFITLLPWQVRESTEDAVSPPLSGTLSRRSVNAYVRRSRDRPTASTTTRAAFPRQAYASAGQEEAGMKAILGW